MKYTQTKFWKIIFRYVFQCLNEIDFDGNNSSKWITRYWVPEKKKKKQQKNACVLPYKKSVTIVNHLRHCETAKSWVKFKFELSLFFCPALTPAHTIHPSMLVRLVAFSVQINTDKNDNWILTIWRKIRRWKISNLTPNSFNRLENENLCSQHQQ